MSLEDEEKKKKVNSGQYFTMNQQVTKNKRNVAAVK